METIDKQLMKHINQQFGISIHIRHIETSSSSSNGCESDMTS